MVNIESQLIDSREKFLGYIRKRISDPDMAEDILQDSLLKAVKAAPKIADDEGLVRWFYRILQNAIIDAYRRRAAELNRRLSYAADADLAVEPEEKEEICECVSELISTLKPEYAEVVKAIDIDGEDAEAVSMRLRVSRNNLKVRSHRARQALKKRLEETCRMCAEHHCLDCSCKR
jgi:RNA polymerase sigma-70 factor (ECF subfamily)